MKKSLIFWLAVSVCTAWILVGCEQEPETKTNTVTKGAAADIAALVELFNDPAVSTVDFYGDLDVDTGTLLIPSGKTLNMKKGDIKISTGVLGVGGSLGFETAGKGIAVSGAGTVVGNQGVLDSVTGVSAVKVKLYNSITAAKDAFTDGDSPVDDAAVLNEDSGNLTDTNIPSGKTLYVLGDLTTNTALPLTVSGGGVKVLGNFVFGATLNISSYPANYDYSNAVLKTSAAGITLTLPATVAVRAINAAAGKLTVAGAATSLTVGSLTGTLELQANVTAVTIGGGDGNVELSANLTALAGTSVFGNTGTTSFTNTTGVTVTTDTNGITFAGDVSFAGDLTLTAVPATFGGTAYFANGKKITLTSDASVITLKDGAGKLAVGTPAGTAADVWKQILVADAGADAVLTPTANTTLTFTETGKVLTQAGTGGHGIALTGGATLISGSSYVVASESGKVGTLTVTGTLTLGPEVLGDYPDAAAPKLVLGADTESNCAVLQGAGKVVAGGTEITGGDASAGWKPVAAGAQTLTIEADRITATGATALTAGHANSAVTVAAGHTLNIGTDATIELGSSLGKFVLTGATGTDGAKLTGAGKVTAVAASIVGGTGGWQAVGEGTTITLTATGDNAVSLTGTGATPKLVGGAEGVISTGSNSTYSALTVQLLEIDLTTAGSIVIPHNGTASTVVLKGGADTLGKLTLDSTQTDTVGTSHYVKIHKDGDTSGKAGISTDKSGVVTGADDDTGAKAGSIAGGETATDNDMTITGQTATNDVTLDNTALFADS